MRCLWRLWSPRWSLLIWASLCQENHSREARDHAVIRTHTHWNWDPCASKRFCERGKGTGASSLHAKANGGPPSFLLFVQTTSSEPNVSARENHPTRERRGWFFAFLSLCSTISLRKNGHFSYSSAVRTTLTQSIGTNPYRYKARQQSYVCSDRSIQKWLALSKDSCLKVFSVVHV